MINSRSMGTKSDGELSKFLQEEIQTEKKNQRSSVKLDGWSVKTDGSGVTLTSNVGGARSGQQLRRETVRVVQQLRALEIHQPAGGGGEVDQAVMIRENILSRVHYKLRHSETHCICVSEQLKNC